MSERKQQPAAMPDDLLRTKLAPPRLQGEFVARAALLARIDEGFAGKVTLIAAPAGFGKTTLVRQWLAQKDEHRRMKDEDLADAVHPSSFILHPSNVAWVTLDTGDNDPVRFWRYVLSACRAWDPAIGKASLAALRMAQQPSFEAVLIPFINELAQLAGRHVLVLEDYHSITAPDVHATVAFLIEHLPDTLHVLITARSEPDLPLARLRARNELTELTAADLRFSRDETRTFLERTLRVTLAPAALSRIEQRVEGWVAGLRLAGLALRNQTEPAAVEQVLTSFSGEQRHVIEYLVDEVLALQAADVQDFLLSTCSLSRLTGALCDAVTGRGDGAQTLDQLDRANLFLIPLGSTSGQRWYRYHALFAEALRQHARQRLGETEIQAQHARASAWYERQGLLHDAVEEAIAGGHAARAAMLVERLLDRGVFNEVHTLLRWIAGLPEPVVRQQPLLCLAYAQALLFTLDRYAPATAIAVERWAALAEATWQAEHNAPRLGQVAVLRAIVAFWQDDLPRAFECSRQALELLAEHDIFHRSTALLHVGQDQLLAGRLDAAQRHIMEARALYEASQNIHGTLAAMQMLGELCFQQGALDQAADYFQRQHDEAIGGEEMLDDQGHALCGLAAIAYERDDLATAERHAGRAGDLGKRRHAEALKVRAAIVLCRVRHARGQTEQARHELQSLATQTRSAALLREIQGWQARLALAAGDLEAAQRWQAAVAAQPKPASRTQQEQEALLAARQLLAQGDSQAALELLAPWRADASAQGRARSEIEILVLQALAHAALADRARAAHALTRALQLGQPREFRRTFLDEGAPLARLLQEIVPNLTQRALAAYAAALLRALPPGSTAAGQDGAPALPEPLSPQEQRVLRLLAAGHSNTEIARELVVSTNTIKTHVKSIYRKLNVGTREEAQAAARELNLW